MTPSDAITYDSNDGFQVQPGAVIGRYVIRDCLWSGGMGAVYSAHDTLVEQDVA